LDQQHHVAQKLITCLSGNSPQQQFAFQNLINTLTLPKVQALPSGASATFLRNAPELTMAQLQVQNQELFLKRQLVEHQIQQLAKSSTSPRESPRQSPLLVHSDVVFHSPKLGVSACPRSPPSINPVVEASIFQTIPPTRKRPASSKLAEALRTKKYRGEHSPPFTATRSLGKDATSVLKIWMFSPEHVDNPYPTEAEKSQLAVQSGITRKQVCNWFVNARKRYWQPMQKQKLQQKQKQKQNHFCIPKILPTKVAPKQQHQQQQPSAGSCLGLAISAMKAQKNNDVAEADSESPDATSSAACALLALTRGF
jgi:hypothetical protein